MSSARVRELADPHLLALNRHIAQRIRLRRQQVGLSQAQLAKRIGVTYQQVHKYERSMNRISAGQLHAIAIALGTEVAFFFEHAEAPPIGDDQSDCQHRLLGLMADVLRIANPQYRLAVGVVAKAMADRANGDEDES